MGVKEEWNNKNLTEFKKTLLKIKGDRDLLAAACHKGLTRMFQTSYFPVLPKILIDNGISPMDWFKTTFELSKGFSTQIIEYCFKIKLHKANEKLRREGLPYEEPGEVSGSIPKILKWSKIFPILVSKQSLLEDLGIIWYLDTICNNEIEWITIIDGLIDLSKVIEKVRKLADKLETITLIREDNEEQPIVRWRDVFRLPL